MNAECDLNAERRMQNAELRSAGFWPRTILAGHGRMKAWALISFCILHSAFCTPRAGAQRDATVPDPDPEVERRSFQVADGFEVNLFAADPLLAKPIQMNFDPAGRL